MQLSRKFENPFTWWSQLFTYFCEATQTKTVDCFHRIRNNFAEFGISNDSIICMIFNHFWRKHILHDLNMLSNGRVSVIEFFFIAPKSNRSKDIHSWVQYLTFNIQNCHDNFIAFLAGNTLCGLHANRAKGVSNMIVLHLGMRQ